MIVHSFDVRTILYQLLKCIHALGIKNGRASRLIFLMHISAVLDKCFCDFNIVRISVKHRIAIGIDHFARIQPR